MRNLRRRIYHQNAIWEQLDTDQRTYGSIGRENSPSFAGWKDTPVTDLIAVLNNERAYNEMLWKQQFRARRSEEEDECALSE